MWSKEVRTILDRPEGPENRVIERFRQSPTKGGSALPEAGPEKFSCQVKILFESACTPPNLAVETSSTVGRNVGNDGNGRTKPEADQAGRADKIGRTPVDFGSGAF
jgi:hypothetical protein